MAGSLGLVVDARKPDGAGDPEGQQMEGMCLFVNIVRFSRGVVEGSGEEARCEKDTGRSSVSKRPGLFICPAGKRCIHKDGTEMDGQDTVSRMICSGRSVQDDMLRAICSGC